MTKWVAHPLLFAAFPIVFLFSRNADHIGPGQIVRPMLTTVICTVIVFGLMRWRYGDRHRAGLATSALVVLFFSYGHAWSAFRDDRVLGLVVGRDLFLLPLWALIAGALLWVAAKPIDVAPDLTRLFNAVAVALVVSSVYTASSAYAQRDPPQHQGNVDELDLPAGEIPADARDIYYLIFDRYGRQDVLADVYGFDNEPFLDDLRERGFVISSGSFANYPKTSHSLSASLSMDYLDRFAADPGPDSPDWKPLYRSLTGFPVASFLQSIGYRYIHIGSWWDPTATDRTADLNHHYDKRSEFSIALYNSTLLLPVGKRAGFAYDRLDPRRVAANQILFELDKAAEARAFEGPTFTFMHLLLPHGPHLFDADGGFVPEDVERSRTREENYLGQVRFANRKIIELVDRLLDAPADEQPIIVIQSDEGPHPRRLGRLDEDFVWTEATDDELREKLGILNAYHVPGVAPDEIPDDITPVNTFRMIFDAYFDTDLEMLEDRIYVFRDFEHPYEFFEVTSRLRR